MSIRGYQQGDICGSAASAPSLKFSPAVLGAISLHSHNASWYELEAYAPHDGEEEQGT